MKYNYDRIYIDHLHRRVFEPCFYEAPTLPLLWEYYPWKTVGIAIVAILVCIVCVPFCRPARPFVAATIKLLVALVAFVALTIVRFVLPSPPAKQFYLRLPPSPPSHAASTHPRLHSSPGNYPAVNGEELGAAQALKGMSKAKVVDVVAVAVAQEHVQREEVKAAKDGAAQKYDVEQAAKDGDSAQKYDVVEAAKEFRAKVRRLKPRRMSAQKYDVIEAAKDDVSAQKYDVPEAAKDGAAQSTTF
ncbi:hypothetical protein BDB00DRAFT_792249 [Zychaea mexicana]|uniref:uncharacterized protein n=1 Tax=Zychaea mexicana TaxID=64656 RepID=UPI0022FE734C|nr:uncharacterized protein BDB00DRAFT_792249 [Zychaea mexicana]KAI9488010.1 hypothetical protein BDB00DRAFT_792249 [Zychaea mexicana]